MVVAKCRFRLVYDNHMKRNNFKIRAELESSMSKQIRDSK